MRLYYRPPYNVKCEEWTIICPALRSRILHAMWFWFRFLLQIYFQLSGRSTFWKFHVAPLSSLFRDWHYPRADAPLVVSSHDTFTTSNLPYLLYSYCTYGHIIMWPFLVRMASLGSATLKEKKITRINGIKAIKHGQPSRDALLWIVKPCRKRLIRALISQQ